MGVYFGNIVVFEVMVECLFMISFIEVVICEEYNEFKWFESWKLLIF